MKWEPISTFEDDGTPVDLWVSDENYPVGGQRFPDMTYREGSAGEANDWTGEMLDLSDCSYGPSDVTHYMRVTAPAT